jgi:hypothetical protein
LLADVPKIEVQYSVLLEEGISSDSAAEGFEDSEAAVDRDSHLGVGRLGRSHKPDL